MHKHARYGYTVGEVMNMKEQDKSALPHYRDGRGLDRMPAGTPWSGKKPNEGRKIDAKHPPYADPPPNNPPVTDPPVPNRAHTEMRTEFPPELPTQEQ